MFLTIRVSPVYNSPSRRRGGRKADGVVDRGRKADTANSPSRRRGGRKADGVVDLTLLAISLYKKNNIITIVITFLNLSTIK